MHDLLDDESTIASIPELINRYWGDSQRPSTYTGPHFDRLKDVKHPNEITEMDMVAVSMLSVMIPARTAICILTDGRDQTRGKLERVPPDVDFRPTAICWTPTATSSSSGIC